MDHDETATSSGDELRWAMSGDRSAFAALVHDHGQAVHAYLARRAGRQVADDLSTEVWLRAWRSRHTYKPAWPDPRPWLYGIARNTLRAHWRQRSDPPRSTFDPAGDPWAEVDDRLDARRLRPALVAALGTLGDKHREVLLLAAWEQLTPNEIAVALSLSPSTVRSRLHRSRRLLQRHLDADLPANPNPTTCLEA